MRKALEFKKCILLIIVAVVICSGLYSGVCETNKPISRTDSFSSPDDYDGGCPLKDSIDTKATRSLIATVAETNGVGTIKDVIKKTRTGVDNHKLGKNILSLSSYHFSGNFSLYALSVISGLTGSTSGRKSIISYIHLQDGEKPSR